MRPQLQDSANNELIFHHAGQHVALIPGRPTSTEGLFELILIGRKGQAQQRFLHSLALT